MKVRNVIGSLALAVAIFTAAPVLAGGGKGKGGGACRADVRRLCKDVKHGEGRIKQCLKDHEADLSDECKAAFKNRRKPT